MGGHAVENDDLQAMAVCSNMSVEKLLLNP
jgi:hypothetical protein